MQPERRSNLARRGLPAAALATAALILSCTAMAATVVGSAKNDVLRGTAKADRLFGKGGNDKLLGLRGNDVLVGGAGKDVLSGGPGADKLQCGPGRDIAQADAADQVGADCEVVQGPVLPAVSIADASIQEGNAGPTKLSFPVTLSKPVTWSVAVTYVTADGSAKAPTDYAPASGTVTFAPGETSKAIDVTVNGDEEVEPDESLSLDLSSPVNVRLADGSATGTIKNEDRPKPRSGRYAGSTSQGRSISFDVSAGATSITNLSISLDVQCVEVDFHDTVPLDFGSSVFRLDQNWRFSIAGSDSNSDLDLTLAIGGALAPGGSASGTALLNITVHTSAGDVHCSSGNVSWNAS